MTKWLGRTVNCVCFAYKFHFIPFHFCVFLFSVCGQCALIYHSFVRFCHLFGQLVEWHWLSVNSFQTHDFLRCKHVWSFLAITIVCRTVLGHFCYPLYHLFNGIYFIETIKIAIYGKWFALFLCSKRHLYASLSNSRIFLGDFTLSTHSLLTALIQ